MHLRGPSFVVTIFVSLSVLKVYTCLIGNCDSSEITPMSDRISLSSAVYQSVSSVPQLHLQEDTKGVIRIRISKMTIHYNKKKL